jgi:hypothetical protein
MMVVCILCGCGRQSDHPVAGKTLISIYGDQYSIVGDAVYRSVRHPELAYVVKVAAPSGAEPARLMQLSDNVFLGFAGSQASLMGFRHVAVAPVSTSAQNGISLFGYKVDLSTSAGPNMIFYDQRPDGTWERDHSGPGSPPRIETYSLKSGAKYALSSKFIHFPAASYVFECLSCERVGISQAALDNAMPVLQGVALPDAEDEKVRVVNVEFFVRQRRTLWDFPATINFHLVRGPDGAWRMGGKSVPSPGQLRTALQRAFAIYKARGAQMRSAMPAQ